MLGATAPCLSENTNGNGRSDSATQSGPMQRPKKPFVAFGCDQGAGVVGESVRGHADFRAVSCTSRSRRTSPAASSSAVSAPACDSHSVTPWIPSRMSSECSAALVSQAENDTPSSVAARSTLAAIVSSRDTDRLVTAMKIMVIPPVVPCNGLAPTCRGLVTARPRVNLRGERGRAVLALLPDRGRSSVIERRPSRTDPNERTIRDRVGQP